MKLKTFLFITLFTIVFSGICSAQSDFQKVKERVIANAMDSEINDSEIRQLLETLKDDGTWPGIDYANVSREGFEHRYHHSNMVTLARAYKTKSSKYYGKKEVKDAIELSLKNWVDNDYFCDNWWHNQIGTPHNLVTLMLITGDELDADLVKKAQPIIGRAHSEAPGARPGGDRIKICGIQAKNCLFLGNDKKFNEVVRIIESEIKFSEWVGAEYGYGFRNIPTGFSNREMGGRGIQYDNSFHHRVDGVNNTLSYGLSYAAAFAEWAVYTTGTGFEFSDEKLAKLIDYFLDGICKTAVYGKYPDMGAKNRSISRENTLKAYDAILPKQLLQTSDYRKNELEEIVAIRENEVKPTVSHATFYWDTEHFSFQRPNWFTSVRMYSTRTHNMEQPYNSEGFLNHYRGDGANHISVKGTEYYDIAPVYDYQKIPGTTVLQNAEHPGRNEVQKLGITDFVGAATDGKYAAVAFDFRSPHDPLIARKSWFFFDEEYVCLGAGISCKNHDFPVVTTLNQCLLRDDVTISSANKKSVLEKGKKEIDDVNWIFQDGVGYVFPKPTSVNIKNSEASGSWWRVNEQSDSPKEEIELDVFKVWIDHGQRPSNESYEYIVVPATTIEKVEQSISKNNVEVIVNSPEVQAVKHLGLKMFQAVFYKAGQVQIMENLNLYCETPGIILIQALQENGAKITVADPNRELGKMVFSVSTKVDKEGDNFKAVWNENKQVTEITIDLPQGNYAGSSVSVIL